MIPLGCGKVQDCQSNFSSVCASPAGGSKAGAAKQVRGSMRALRRGSGLQWSDAVLRFAGGPVSAKQGSTRTLHLGGGLQWSDAVFCCAGRRRGRVNTLVLPCPSGAGFCRHSKQSRPLLNSHPGQHRAGMSMTAPVSKVQRSPPPVWRGGAPTSPHSGRVSRRVLSGPNGALTDESQAWLCPTVAPDGADTPSADASRAAAEAFSAADHRSLGRSHGQSGL